MVNKGLLIAFLAFVSACSAARAARTEPLHLPASLADTVSILEAVWRAATARSTERVDWLHVPQVDTLSLATSGSVLDALVRRNVPATARPPAGDDTTVFRVRSLTVTPEGEAVVELLSKRKTVLGSGTRRCRAASGNVETYRAKRTTEGWRAERFGSVIHGDNGCRPV